MKCFVIFSSKKKIWQVSVAGNKRLLLAANTCQIFFFWSKYSKYLHVFQDFQEFFKIYNIYFGNFLLKLMQHLTIRTIKKTFSRCSMIPCNQSFKNKFNFQKNYWKIEKSEVFCNIFIKKKIWQMSVAGNKRLLLAANTCQIFFLDQIFKKPSLFSKFSRIF